MFNSASLSSQKSIIVYTDGSCSQDHGIGGWAAILFLSDQKIILKGRESNTTHQRMELTAVLKALEYLQENKLSTMPVNICADSQYVIDVRKRRSRLEAKHFLTKKGEPIRNDDLVKKLIQYLDTMTIEFTKVVAHQKLTETENFNREADKIARSIVRNEQRTINN